MGKITVKALEALRPVDIGLKLRDDGGMLGIVRQNGEKVSVQWSWRYRFGGKVHQVSLGTWPKTNIQDIRNKRLNIQEKVKQGLDPVTVRQAEKLHAKAELLEQKTAAQSRVAEAEAAQARITVKELFKQWELSVLSNHKDKGVSVLQAFNRDVFAQIGGIAVEDVKRAHIVALVEKIKERGVGRTAKRVFSLVRQMFRYALENEILEVDPTATINKSKIAKDVERERVLSEAEVSLLFKALPVAGMSKTSKLALMIQLATTCRIGELLQARWEHIDLANGTWFIHADTAKNYREHTISLSSFALAQFKALHVITGATDEGTSKGTWAFPARLKKDAHVCVKSVTKQVGDRQRGDRAAMSNRSPLVKSLVLPGGGWTPHDLRRTGATMMVSLGVAPIVADKCLNHKEQGKMMRIYLRYDYKAEMREAWQLLGDRLELLTSDHGNVFTFPAKQA